MKRYLAGCALAALATGSAYAQSTGSQQFEQQQDIVVTGSNMKNGVDGFVTPDAPKTREVLTSQFIQHQTPGQTINDIINLLPGVSFQNNDGYGGAGGFLTIRGFDQSRISETFDGIPLNDTGNYALYSNQQLDPELIDQVNVSLGSTDVDSPTPSATGSTINYTTRTPSEDFHVRIQGSAGSFHELRVFSVLDTGIFTPFGTRAWISGSKQDYNSPFDSFAKINRRQFNAKVYQPVGSSGDFVSVAGHYNYNKNNFFGSAPLRLDNTILNANGQVIGTRTPGIDSNVNRFPDSRNEDNYQNQLYYNLGPCTRLAPAKGTAQVETTTLSATGANKNQAACGSEYDDRFNPSKTANIRVNSRFTLADHLILTVDPFYEYTDANGGGTMKASEGVYTQKNAAGKTIFTGIGAFGGTFYTGRDINNDGDTLDTTLLLAPSNTVTNRYGVIANLIYDFMPDQTVRVNYTLDYGHHRQTGEATTLSPSGEPANLFPHDNDAYVDSRGNVLQKRDRLSRAILNQVAAQYRGRFLDEKLTLEAGVRAAFFSRKLDQRCFTTAINGNVDCPEDDTEAAAYAAANPYSINATTGLPIGFAPPGKRDYHFNKALPSAGLVYQITPMVSVYGDYSKGLQVPGTDQLYNAYYFPRDNANASPKPETADNFDAGIRARSGKIQAQVAGWYTIFHNRIEQNYDPILQLSTYTNLGTVHRYGVDGSIAYQPDRHFTVYGFGSYLKSKILDDVQIGTCTNGVNALVGPTAVACTVGSAIYADTAGRRESGAPVFTYGGRLEGNYGPVVLGIQAKRTGPRYINDQNKAVYQSYGTGLNTVYYEVYGKKTPSYTIVDLDARISLEPLVHTDRTYFQFNVTNLFNKFFVGASSTSNSTPSNTTVNFWQIGAPRTISGTLVVGF